MTIKKAIRFLSIHSLAVAFAILSQIGPLDASEGGSPFKNILSFGDSLSDSGNLYALTGGAFPPPPDFEGRKSNGILWNEYLAHDLGSELLLKNNYSFIGAKTGTGNLDLNLPGTGFLTQVDQYLADVGDTGAHPQDLFIVGAGANDFFGFFLQAKENPLDAGVDNTVEGIERLLVAGARHVVVLNVPDLGRTPLFAFSTAPLSEYAGLATSLSGEYNRQLAIALKGLEAEYPANIVMVDAYSIINQIQVDPSAFGLNNGLLPSNPSISAPFGNPDPNKSLFWDFVHPTTAGHRILADFALDAVIESYLSPSGKAFDNASGLTPAAIGKN